MKVIVDIFFEIFIITVLADVVIQWIKVKEVWIGFIFDLDILPLGFRFVFE